MNPYGCQVIASSAAAISTTLGFYRYGQEAIIYCLSSIAALPKPYLIP
jgi:hypothetical protein